MYDPALRAAAVVFAVVVGLPKAGRIRHVTESVVWGFWCVAILAHEPILVLDEAAEKVRVGLVERTRFVVIVKASGPAVRPGDSEPDHSVRELMSHHIQCMSEGPEASSVAISVDDLVEHGNESCIVLVTGESIVEATVHRGDHLAAFAIDAVQTEIVKVVVVDNASVPVRAPGDIIHGLTGDRTVLSDPQRARQGAAVLRIVGFPLTRDLRIVVGKDDGSITRIY